MTDFYRRAQITSTGGAMGPNKGVLFNSGAAAATATFHTIESSNYDSSAATGVTQDLAITLPANTTQVIPIQMHTYHQNTSENAKVYKLN
tara:strand:- start:383 stop:652 length:270 start_codon:yes stop_codon:yes gene_type:complete